MARVRVYRVHADGSRVAGTAEVVVTKGRASYRDFRTLDGAPLPLVSGSSYTFPQRAQPRGDKPDGRATT